MKKFVIVSDYMNTVTGIYRELERYAGRNSFDLLISNALYSQENTLSVVARKVFNKVREIGPLNLLRMVADRNNTVVLTGGATQFYRALSRNVMLLVHGAGIKSTPARHEIAKADQMNKYRQILRNTDYIVVGREDEGDHYMNCPELADVKRPVFLPLGMPRNDYLFENKDNPEIIRSIDKKIGVDKRLHKIVLYAPTYREFREDNEAMTDFLIAQFEQMDKKLKEQKVVLLYRPHYFVIGLKQRFKEFTNIHYAGNDEFSEQRDLMLYADTVISDYSSIYIDFLLLDRPVMFYPFDLERYLDTRGLMLDYGNDLHFPGPRLKSLKDLLDITPGELKKYNPEQSKKYFFKYPDGNATRRVTEYLLGELLKVY